VVRAAIERGIELDDLSLADRSRLLPELAHLDDAAWRRELSVDAVLARRRVTGGTAPERVRAEAARWKALLHSRVPLAHVSAPVSRTSNPT
jgi:argininosuccinate lyase